MRWITGSGTALGRYSRRSRHAPCHERKMTTIFARVSEMLTAGASAGQKKTSERGGRYWARDGHVNDWMRGENKGQEGGSEKLSLVICL